MSETSDVHRTVPAHLIAFAQVEAWLRGSAWPPPTYHSTDAESAEAIWEHGVDMAVCSPDSAYGRAFYTTSRIDPAYGEATVRTAVRLVQPLIIDDSIEGAATIDRWMTDFDTADAGEAIR